MGPEQLPGAGIEWCRGAIELLPRYGSWNDYAYIAEHQEPRPFYVGERHNSKEGLTQPWKGSTDLHKKSDFKEPPSVDELLENSASIPTTSPLSTFTARRDGNLNDLLHENGDREALNRANGVRSRAADGAWEPPVKIICARPRHYEDRAGHHDARSSTRAGQYSEFDTKTGQGQYPYENGRIVYGHYGEKAMMRKINL